MFAAIALIRLSICLSHFKSQSKDLCVAVNRLKMSSSCEFSRLTDAFVCSILLKWTNNSGIRTTAFCQLACRPSPFGGQDIRARKQAAACKPGSAARWFGTIPNPRLSGGMLRMVEDWLKESHDIFGEEDIISMPLFAEVVNRC
jgi:hypothetical protein